MSARVKALIAAQKKIRHEDQQLCYAAEGREFTPDELEKRSAWSEELARLDSELEAAVEEAERNEKRSEVWERAEKLTAAKTEKRSDSGLDAVNVEFRSAANDRDYKAAVDLTPLRKLHLRSLATDTANMPLADDFVSQLYRFLRDNRAVLTAGPRLYVTSNGSPLEVPRVTAHPTASWTAEQEQYSKSDPTIGSITLGAHKIGLICEATEELVEDVEFDLVPYLAESMAESIRQETNAAYLVGDGNEKPTGIIPNTNVGWTGDPSATAVVTYEDLIEMTESLNDGHLANAVWVMRPATLAKVRQITDGDGRLIWQTSLVPGTPSTLLGYPVLRDPNVPAMAPDARSILFGDFRGYAIRLVGDVRFRRSDEVGFETDMITWKAKLRTDGKLLDPNALKVFKHGPVA